MDELTIGDKIYISSKRAAKITGYAKDYVGQLCREGRVEARLVGRSWYVLESAIRAHRFGNESVKKEVATDSSEFKVEASTAIWEAPRYVSEPEAPLMPVFAATKPPEVVVEAVEPTPAVSMMQDAWKEWFETRERSLPQNEEKAMEDEPYPQLEVEVESPVEMPEEDTVAVRATDISNEYNISNVSQELIPPATIPQSNVEAQEQFDSFEEEERVPFTIKRPEPSPAEAMPPRAHVSGGVIDLSRRTSAPRPRTNARIAAPITGKSRSRVNSIQAVLVAVAGMALITALVGSGVMDAFLAQRGIDTSVRGHVFDFVRGESEIKK
ncbi:MAG: hypothetical protein V4681_03800 [Patescibacteria group bacterium]